MTVILGQAGWTPANIAAGLAIFVVITGLALFVRRTSFQLEDIDLRHLTAVGWLVIAIGTALGLAVGWFVLQELTERGAGNRFRSLATVLSFAAIAFGTFLGASFLLARVGIHTLRNRERDDPPAD